MSSYNYYSTFDFSEALRRIKKGRKVSRRGWNGKSQYIQILNNVSGYTSSGKVESNKAIGFFGTSGLQIGWLASQADMLAEDWYDVTNIESDTTDKGCTCNATTIKDKRCTCIDNTANNKIVQPVKTNQNVYNAIKDLGISDKNDRNINVTVTADTLEDVFDLIKLFKHLS